MKIRLRDLKKKAAMRPEGYYDEVVSKGQVVGDVLVIDGPSYIALLKKFNPAILTPTKTGKSCCGGAPSSSIKMPPLSVQMANAAGAAGRLVKNLVSGNRIKADDLTIKNRTEICAGCDFWAKERQRCSICGCYTKLKITIKDEVCPKGFW